MISHEASETAQNFGTDTKFLIVKDGQVDICTPVESSYKVPSEQTVQTRTVAVRDRVYTTEDGLAGVLYNHHSVIKDLASYRVNYKMPPQADSLARTLAGYNSYQRPEPGMPYPPKTTNRADTGLLAEALVQQFDLNCIHLQCHFALWARVWSNYQLMIHSVMLGDSVRGVGYPALAKYGGNVGCSNAVYVAEADGLRSGVTVPFTVHDDRSDEMAAILRLFLAAGPVIEPYLEVENPAALLQPPAGGDEFLLNGGNFGTVADDDEMMACSSAYRFSENITVLIFSEIGFLPAASGLPGDNALLAAGIHPASTRGNNYHRALNKRNLESLLTPGKVREALALLSRVIPDAAGCVAGAALSWAISSGTPGEGQHEPIQRGVPPTTGFLFVGKGISHKAHWLCSQHVIFQGSLAEKLQLVSRSVSQSVSLSVR